MVLTADVLLLTGVVGAAVGIIEVFLQSREFRICSSEGIEARNQFHNVFLFVHYIIS